MKKSLIFVAVCALITVFGYIKAEQGDFATLGYNTPGGYSYWRVASTGDFVPGVASTYGVGTAALPVKAVYAGNISAGTISATSPLALPSYSSTTLKALAPAAAGTVVYGSTYQSLCVSTGTGIGAWVFVSTNGFTGSPVACDQ